MRRIPTLCLAAVMTATLGACAVPPSAAPDPARSHPVRVELETFQVTVPLSRATSEQPLPADFTEEYYRRGRGPMTLVLPAGADARAVAAGQEMVATLKKRLIPATLGRAVHAGEVEDGGVSVFFKAYVAQVPECGDWRGAATYNPENLPHTNFGCSLQRNVGLMLSDPGELLGAPTTGGPDAGRAADTIIRYRGGERIGAPPPPSEQTTITLER